MSALVPRKSSRLVPLLMAVACVLALAAALVSQHAFDMRPCPWCILQRLIFIVIALLCVAAAFAPSRPVRVGLLVLTFVSCGLGVASAMYQHDVASKMYSCNLTFADRIISGLGVESVWPAMFQVTATCAEAAVSLLGVPFEYWSLAMFALLGLGAAALVLRSVRLGGGQRRD